MGNATPWPDISGIMPSQQQSLEMWKTFKKLPLQTTPVIYCRQEEVVSRKLQDIAMKLDNIISRIEKIESVLEADEILECRNISKEEAKKEIKAYFEEHHGENFYASDIEDNLGIEYDLVMEIFEELESEREIKAL